ncbi:MAG: aminoacyl-tRNA hydrolase, partial [Pirellulaceae bacterium]|nr:aminoacyl-tRNA hydrolase [Pirellulaceae bacterium]
RFEGEFAEGVSAGEKLMVLCPHTFMNASGQSVRKAVDFYKLHTDDLLVVCDDLNLASGRLRIRPRGSAGGQNGLKDIIRHLDGEVFPRLRIGIGQPPDGWTVTDYVLGKFPKSEQDKIESATTRAAYAAIDWATNGIGSAMNQFNADPDAPKTPAKPKRANKQPNQTSRPNQTGQNELSDTADKPPTDHNDGENS